MIQTFIKKSDYTFDLGSIYKHILLNQGEIEGELGVEAFHSLMSFQKNKVKPKIPFYPKNWEIVKDAFDEYQNNNLNSIPNKYYFVKTVYDESQLSNEEKNLILHSTSVAIEGEVGSYDYDWDKWKKYQYDIFSLEEEFIVEWEDSEFQRYWLSWYLVLLDESLFNNNLHSWLSSITGLDKNGLNELLEDVFLKHLSIFLLTDWDRKMSLITSEDLIQNHEEVKNIGNQTKTSGRDPNDVFIGKLISRKEVGDVTDLSLDQTLALFTLLDKFKCIVLDKKIVSKATSGKVIAAITGYSSDTLSRRIENYKIEEETYRELRKIISPLTLHINSVLDK
jgi:hypothetical protein